MQRNIGATEFSLNSCDNRYSGSRLFMTQVEVICKNSTAVLSSLSVWPEPWVVFTESETQEQHLSLVTRACPQSLPTEVISTQVT